jgi:hypothetical protein
MPKIMVGVLQVGRIIKYRLKVVDQITFVKFLLITDDRGEIAGDLAGLHAFLPQRSTCRAAWVMPLRAEIPKWNLRWPYPPAVRSRNGILYLTARRFSAQDRVNAVRAIKRLKAETGLAAEIALLRLPLSPCCRSVSLR